MAMIYLQARDKKTGAVVGYRSQQRVVYDRNKATWYVNSASARVGIETARKRFPQYDWFPVDRAGNALDIGVTLQQKFSRAEVVKLLEAEREACAQGCDHIASMMKRQPGEIGEAQKCAYLIRHNMLPVVERLK